MSSISSGPTLSRRTLLGAAAAIGATPVLSACGGVSTSGADGGEGAVNFLSTQFSPVEERQRFETILKNRVKNIEVAFNPVDNANFTTTIQSQVDAKKVEISLIGGLHGDLAPQAARLVDLGDVAKTLASKGVDQELLDLGKLGGSTTKYIPWMQATYLLAINKKALQWLPSGAKEDSLTYDQLLQWAIAGRAGNGGKPIFGMPAGPKGLYHRFFQGYLLPSFTGAQMTRFRSADAVAGWNWMKELWANTNTASTNYDFMQEPLERGEVLIAWDHVARLVNAPKSKPGDWLMVPAPRGPKGLGYMLVIAGLGIPNGAPEAGRAKDVIKALAEGDTQVEVLRQNAFFPVVDANLPSDLPGGVGLEAPAVKKQQDADGAIVSLPPVGLGAKDGEVSQIFKNTFKEICIDKKPVQQVLDSQGGQLDVILSQLKVPCWKPDPAGAACQVG
jgi:multiple sugar transport system substrate-binding protein